MPTKKYALSLYLDHDVYDQVKQAADRENRSVNNFIEQYLAVTLPSEDPAILRRRMNPALTRALREDTLPLMPYPIITIENG